MIKWQPIETAPKDGTWIVGFCGGDSLYTVMRWWDGVLPEVDDDLSTDEVGEWVSSDDQNFENVTHWIAFEPHPLAPPKTASFDHYDEANGIRHKSRAERGVTDDQVGWSQIFHDVLHVESYDNGKGFDEAAQIAQEAANRAFPGVEWGDAE